MNNNIDDEPHNYIHNHIMIFIHVMIFTTESVGSDKHGISKVQISEDLL